MTTTASAGTLLENSTTGIFSTFMFPAKSLLQRNHELAFFTTNTTRGRPQPQMLINSRDRFSRPHIFERSRIEEVTSCHLLLINGTTEGILAITHELLIVPCRLTIARKHHDGILFEIISSDQLQKDDVDTIVRKHCNLITHELQ